MFLFFLVFNFVKNHTMTIEIQLPSDKKEAVFILELLKKLNLIYEPQDEVREDISDELKMLLRGRIADMEANPNDVISWADIQSH